MSLIAPFRVEQMRPRDESEIELSIIRFFNYDINWFLVIRYFATPSIHIIAMHNTNIELA